MARNITVTFADGTNHVYQNAPDDVTPDMVQARAEKEFSKPVKGLDGGGAAKPVEQQKPETTFLQGAGNLAKGALVGLSDIGDTAIDLGVKATGGMIPKLDQWNRTRNADMEYIQDKYKDSPSFTVGRIGGNVASTFPVGGVLGQGAKALGASPAIVNALATGGMRAGANPGALNTLAKIAGGATTGGVSSALINPESAGIGAAIGGAIPVVGSVGKYLANGVGSLIRPFYDSGQDVLMKNALRALAENPNALAFAKNFGEIIPGSAPTSIAALGDTGLAGLGRTMQSANPKYAVDLANREVAQNAARTAVIEDAAGNTGKIAAAKDARDLATGSLRDEVLQRAGNVPSGSVINSIDNLLKNPDNAGKISQQALNEFKGRISQFTQDGNIDARALYAIRKDINDVLGGKLQGESGNLKNASSQLIKVKGLIDDAIDKASRAIPQSASREVAPYGGGSVSTITTPANKGPQATWSQYLKEYADQSKPINQMEALSDVMRRVQTGTTDKQGNLILSAPKLNTILKNETPDLVKTLTSDQLELLRNLAADLNASQLSMSSGKSIGSDTAQKISGNSLLTNLLGKTIGGSSSVTNTLGLLSQLPYKAANKQMMEKMGDALLDPNELARIANTKEGSDFLRMLSNSSGVVASKSAPSIAALSKRGQ